MYIPLHYQVSEYDCVPTAFINAVCYLFERSEVPPMVVRHISIYCLDTVGPSANMGSGGTSRYAVRLLGHWLASYKYKKFSMATEYLEEDDVHLRQDSRILACLEEGGVALCSILLGDREEHYVLAVKEEDGWLYCFDPYYRTHIHGLSQNVGMLDREDGRSPNLKIRLEWMDQEDDKLRFCLGSVPRREGLLVWRNR